MTLQEKEKKIVEVIKELKKVNYPGYSRDIVSFGFIKKIDVDESGYVFVDIEVPTEKEDVFESIREKVYDVLKHREDVEISVRKREIFKKNKIPIRGKSIAIYSTKGGVGKSTVAVNLAYSIKKIGFNTAVLDLDIHGPSVPRITGTQDYEPYSPDGKNISPAEKFGVKIMSIGYMAKGDTPVIWRGPMVMKAFRTLTFSTLWADTDVLVMDLPPGSGDVQLSLAQEADISGMVMITTPQELALEDLRRGISMFKKLSVPILGVIENMSYFTCDSCGKRHYIFGKGGGRDVAKSYGIDFIGEIPFDPDLMKMSDEGRIYVLEKDGEVSESFESISKKILEKLSLRK
ncbi:MAG: Mrp/NBP35 family ATP-binding protein [Candidatus Calescibacterium sp.]|nr:Mrp/NBP35 family ATP-binding protein [Candidatus Calescibacterium sp.]MCX7733959.1 Mrp/NBP35 family ATP-binding protein [bacterium]MDW8086442.1 Mrp/NBP35 family ATP-binding protein [Candidatus Calescibacterium sp.]